MHPAVYEAHSGAVTERGIDRQQQRRFGERAPTAAPNAAEEVAALPGESAIPSTALMTQPSNDEAHLARRGNRWPVRTRTDVNSAAPSPPNDRRTCGETHSAFCRDPGDTATTVPIECAAWWQSCGHGWFPGPPTRGRSAGNVAVRSGTCPAENAAVHAGDGLSAPQKAIVRSSALRIESAARA